MSESPERKVRAILIGRSTAGKTTLCQALYHDEIKYRKTQTVNIINQQMIDTPGEYLERGYMRGALTTTSADADLIILVQDATENGSMFPPGYANSYGKPSIGVVTKIDIASEKQIENAKKYLMLAGVRKIFKTSSYKNEGCKELFEWIEAQKERRGKFAGED